MGLYVHLPSHLSNGANPSGVKNLCAFGPVGGADDSATFQAAANVGGRIVIPAGTYNILRTISLSSGTELCGEPGAVVAGDTAGAKFVSSGKDRVAIRDLTISGAHTWGVMLVGGRGHKVIGCEISGGTKPDAQSKCGGIYLQDVDAVTVEGNSLSGNGAGESADIQANFGTYRITNSRIVGNTCTSAVTSNILLFDPRRVVVEGNVCSGAKVGADARRGGYGIALYRTQTVPTANVGECVVAGNAVSDTEGTGVYIQSCRDTTVMGNVVVDTCAAQDDTSLGVGGIALGDSPGCVVSGNKVLNSGSTGITVASASHGSSITGNVVDGSAKQGVAIRGTVADVVVSGNTVRNSTLDGIGSWSDLAAERVSITNNVVRNSGRGIYAAPSAVGWQVANNLVA